MNTFFTADTHFQHANIIKYCNRPFPSVGEMDEALIRNWNSVVGPSDVTYHLGDFSFRDPSQYLRRLNGHIYFVHGNHDKPMKHYQTIHDRERKVTFLPALAEATVECQTIVLCHYSLRTWNKSHYGVWHLYGHSHGTLPDDPHARSLDVGVDVHGYRPIAFEEVSIYMAKKLWKPIDHHEEKQEGGGVGLSKDDYEKADRRRRYEQLKREFDK